MKNNKYTFIIDNLTSEGGRNDGLVELGDFQYENVALGSYKGYRKSETRIPSRIYHTPDVDVSEYNLFITKNISSDTLLKPLFNIFERIVVEAFNINSEFSEYIFGEDIDCDIYDNGDEFMIVIGGDLSIHRLKPQRRILAKFLHNLTFELNGDWYLDEPFMDISDSSLNNIESIEEIIMRQGANDYFLCFRSSLRQKSLQSIILRVEKMVETSLNKLNLIPLQDLDDQDIIRRIEFSPEDYQAGLGIIAYFNTYLKENYPKADASVTIEQQSNAVRMIIRPESGKAEIVNKALNEYSLIMSGEVKPEYFIEDKINVARLYTKIDLLNSELNAEKRINGILKDDLKSFRKILELSVSNPTNINISNNNQLNLSLQNEIISSVALLKELENNLIENKALKEEVQNLLKTFEDVAEDPSSTKVSQTNLISKIENFISKVSKAQDTAEKVFKISDRGAIIYDKFLKHYHTIASIISGIM